MKKRGSLFLIRVAMIVLSLSLIFLSSVPKVYAQDAKQSLSNVTTKQDVGITSKAATQKYTVNLTLKDAQGNLLAGYSVRLRDAQTGIAWLTDSVKSDANGKITFVDGHAGDILSQGHDLEVYIKFNAAGESVTPSSVATLKNSELVNGVGNLTVLLRTAQDQIIKDAKEEAANQWKNQDYELPPSKVKFKILFVALGKVSIHSPTTGETITRDMPADEPEYAKKVADELEQLYNDYIPNVEFQVDFKLLDSRINIESDNLGRNSTIKATLSKEFLNFIQTNTSYGSYDSIMTVNTIDNKGQIGGGTTFSPYTHSELNGASYSNGVLNTTSTTELAGGRKIPYATVLFSHEFCHVMEAMPVAADKGEVHKLSAYGYGSNPELDSRIPHIDLLTGKVKDIVSTNPEYQDKYCGIFPKMWQVTPRFLNAPSEVKVNYVDQNGKKIKDTDFFFGPSGDPYNISQADIPEYHLVSVNGAPSEGVLEADTIKEVTYVYAQGENSAVVQFSDLGFQYWLKDMAEHYTGKIVGKDMTFQDLEKMTVLQSYTGFEMKDTTPVLPAGIKYFTGLKTLKLSELGLTGTVPAEVGSLTNLTTLNLAYNQFTGNIPAQISQLTNLQTLYLGANSFSGTIPASFINLKKVSNMDLSSTNLTGTIDMLPQMTSLQRLRLENTKLVGQIPDGLFHMDFNDLDFRNTELTLNQVGNKLLDNGKTPKYTNSFVNERFLTTNESNLSVVGSKISPFKDFGLQVDLNGVKSSLFDGHTYQIYRTSDNKLMYSGEWDDDATFEQTDASEEYRIVLDGASENPHNVTTITVNQKQEVKGNIQVVVKDDAGNVVPGVTVGWKDLTTNFTGNSHVTDTDGAFSQTGMSFEHQYQYTVSSVPAGYVNTGDTIKVTPSGQAGDTYVVNLTVLRDVTVNPMTEIQDTVTGTAAANVKLRYFVDGQAVNVGTSNADGTYKKVIGLHKAGTVIGVQMQDPKTGKYLDLKTITVTPLAAKVTVNELTTNDAEVSGTAPANVKLRFLIDGQPVNVGTSNADGTYKKVIGLHKAGTVVGVQMFDPALGNYSDVVSTTVKEGKAPVQVAPMTTTDTSIHGTAPANAKLRIVVNGQAVNVVYANADGEFTKVIGKQAEGSVVGVELFNATTSSYEPAVTVQVTAGKVVDEPARLNPISAKEGLVSGTVDPTVTQVRVWLNDEPQTMVAVQEGTFTWKNTSLKVGDVVKVDYKNSIGQWIPSQQMRTE
ncbi:MucBP domain-containing protein [Listeria aquatica]|uniref:MucBP domain-containing protein n=1 Tax=Listeria aquatica TaxID=1494960 RepID=UPI003EF3A3CB